MSTIDMKCVFLPPFTSVNPETFSVCFHMPLGLHKQDFIKYTLLRVGSISSTQTVAIVVMRCFNYMDFGT